MARTRSTSAAREPLSRERIARAAVALADTEGLDALTMRRLGQSMGVEAMSLYHHFPDKAAILDAALDHVVAEFPMPDRGLDWRSSIRTSLIDAFAVLWRHRWASNVLLGRTARQGPARLRYNDWLLGTLRGAGCSVELTHHAYHVLENYLNGTAAAAASFPFERSEIGTVAAEAIRRLDADRYPHLVEHLRYHASEDLLGEGEFEFGLDLILTSLEHLRLQALPD